MTPSRAWLEQRRLMAGAELRSGVRQADIFRKYGVSRTTASRWCRAADLHSRKSTGRPPRVAPEEMLALFREREHWTYIEFGDAICERFGVELGYNVAGRYLTRFRRLERTNG